ncbi:AraC family transcriptional regulator [Niallia circulans]
MIGYQDDKYFRKVFKKIIGVSPNEYREMEIR